MDQDWTHPLRLTRDEIEELVVKELRRRNMVVKGQVKFVVNGSPPALDHVEAAVVVKPVAPEPAKV